ncbi:TIGR00725 family protein [Variovorax sp. LT2P21]|uniref:TIGR00725 family protein n=1 Tax=Variovorax sp. LT2P21 TaxID=3443731 RepID=UPI003F45B92D
MSLPEGVNAVPSAPVIEALARLAQRQKGVDRHRQPVAMIGPGDGGARECDAARTVAYHLASAGVAVICGGRGGVMAAASRGATEAGGIAIGILPEDDDRNANEWLSVAVPTGMGELRNGIVARSGVCLVAIGGNMGTLSEIAMGLKWGKPVFVLYGDVALPDAVAATDVDDLLERVVNSLLT